MQTIHFNLVDIYQFLLLYPNSTLFLFLSFVLKQFLLFFFFLKSLLSLLLLFISFFFIFLFFLKFDFRWRKLKERKKEKKKTRCCPLSLSLWFLCLSFLHRFRHFSASFSSLFCWLFIFFPSLFGGRSRVLTNRSLTTNLINCVKYIYLYLFKEKKMNRDLIIFRSLLQLSNTKEKNQIKQHIEMRHATAF